MRGRLRPEVVARFVGAAAQGLSLALAAFLTLAYALRPDPLAAATMVPVWIWLPAGLILAGWPGKRRRPSVCLWGVWLVFSACFVDELCPLVHPGAGLSMPHPGKPAPDALRIVSLNCAGGDPAAAAEVVAWQPDIVLLQESPREPAVRALARRLYGSERAAVVGLDTAVLAKDLVALPVDRRTAGARVPLPSGRALTVISARLNPTTLRADLWSPECWRAFTRDRRARRDELAELLARTPVTSGPLLIGGDLNAPAGDAALWPLRDRGLRDAFRSAGAGWGDTIANELPIHRIDQLWTRGLAPRSLIAVRTVHSDHRMVVADFAPLR